jgi:hypothetical protein
LSSILSSPTRRWVLIGVLLAAVAVLIGVAQRDRRPVPQAGGEFGGCARLEGDAARACYRREVGRELMAVGGGPKITIAAPADGTAVTFTSDVAASSDPLLCDLHVRVGAVDAAEPNWTAPIPQS